jgi:hypothetical protein
VVKKGVGREKFDFAWFCKGLKKEGGFFWRGWDNRVGARQRYNNK